jgi:hypothetical protein
MNKLIEEARQGVVQFPYIYYIQETYTKGEGNNSISRMPTLSLNVKKTFCFTLTGIKLLYRYFIRKESIPRIKAKY